MATLTNAFDHMAKGGTAVYDNIEYYVMKAEDKEVMLRKPYGTPFMFYKGMLGNRWILKEV